MCQYFACDADPILENSRIPVDAATKQLCELVPNGPLLDYLRMPLPDPAASRRGLSFAVAGAARAGGESERQADEGNRAAGTRTGLECL